MADEAEACRSEPSVEPRLSNCQGVPSLSNGRRLALRRYSGAFAAGRVAALLLLLAPATCQPLHLRHSRLLDQEVPVLLVKLDVRPRNQEREREGGSYGPKVAEVIVLGPLLLLKGLQYFPHPFRYEQLHLANLGTCDRSIQFMSDSIPKTCDRCEGSPGLGQQLR